MPVNLIFVGMIWTSFFALKNLGVPMATVLKNVTNLFTIVGDYLLYGKVHIILFCLFGMLLNIEWQSGLRWHSCACQHCAASSQTWPSMLRNACGGRFSTGGAPSRSSACRLLQVHMATIKVSWR